MCCPRLLSAANTETQGRSTPTSELKVLTPDQPILVLSEETTTSNLNFGLALPGPEPDTGTFTLSIKPYIYVMQKNTSSEPSIIIRSY